MATPRGWGAVLAFVAVVAAPVRASAAEERAREGTVVAIDAGDLVVDVGSASGARVGAIVELWRPMRIRHPVTGKVLVDRFKIGTVRLTEVQNVLSLARVGDATFQRPPTTGDVVVLPPAEKAPEPAPQPMTDAPAAAAPSTTIVIADPEAKELSDLFASLEGKDPPSRVRSYASFLQRHPKSRFLKVLREETTALQKMIEAERPYDVSVAELERVMPGRPPRVAVELDTRFVGAVVHVRRAGVAGYRSLPMSTAGPRYWAATLPADVAEGSRLEYFVEGVPKSGPPVAVVGTASTPKDTPIDARPLVGKEPGTLATLALSSEIASFNLRRANDYVFQTEGTFGWRLRDTGVRAVRSGFGVIRGKGGSLVDLDQLDRPPRDVGLTYGWIETELATSGTFSLLARPIIGLRQEGVTGGAQGFFRVGSDLATNLLIGGEVLGSVGLRGIVELQWKTIPRVPIVARSEVTNQPAGVDGDIGARVVLQVGYELVPNLAVAVRGSFQGRTINHSGPGAGAGVSYQW